jgi:hypothetical protein
MVFFKQIKEKKRITVAENIVNFNASESILLCLSSIIFNKVFDMLHKQNNYNKVVE